MDFTARCCTDPENNTPEQSTSISPPLNSKTEQEVALNTIQQAESTDIPATHYPPSGQEQKQADGNLELLAKSRIVELSKLKIHPKVDDLLRKYCLIVTWDELFKKQSKGSRFLRKPGATLLADHCEFRAVASMGIYLCYTNTWVLRHISIILPSTTKVRIILDNSLNRRKLEQAVISEYFLRPILYLLPQKKDWLSTLRDSIRLFSGRGLIAEFTQKSFADWLHCSISSQRK